MKPFQFTIASDEGLPIAINAERVLGLVERPDGRAEVLLSVQESMQAQESYQELYEQLFSEAASSK